MAKLASLATDLQAEKDGLWFEYANGIECLIARINNPAFMEYMRKQSKGFRKPQGGSRKRRQVRIDEEQLMELSKEGVAKHVLLDVRGLDKDDAVPVDQETRDASGHDNWREDKDGMFIEQQPYTPEFGLTIFEDEQYKDFWEWVVRTANNAAYYRKEVDDDSAGN